LPQISSYLFISPRYLRARSTDRSKILHNDH